MDKLDIYLIAFAPTLGVFLLLWPLSLRLKDASIVDGWWGPGFLAAAGTAWALNGAATGCRALAILAFLGLWAGRLGFTTVRRRLRLGREEPRYADVRRSWGAGFWWKSFFIIFLLQGVLQWTISLTALAGLLAPAAPFGALGAFGAIVALAGLALEATSDAQLDRFKRDAPAGALLTAGLRAHMRYPSYTGEMLFWWGLWAIAAEAEAWWSALSPLIVTVLLTRISGAPMTDAHLRETRPAYADWAARTPAFLPRLR